MRALDGRRNPNGLVIEPRKRCITGSKKSFLRIKQPLSTGMLRGGHTPGYDLSYRDETDQLIGVEVKGTTLARFPSIELTGNEWRAAGDMGSRFRMALVSGVGKADSQIAFLDDPSGLAERGQTHCVAQFMADLWRHGSPGGHGLARALRLRSPSWPRSRSAETFL